MKIDYVVLYVGIKSFLLKQKHKSNGFSYSKSDLIFIVENFILFCLVKKRKSCCKIVLSRLMAPKLKSFFVVAYRN